MTNNFNSNMPPKSKPVRNGVVVDNSHNERFDDMASAWGFPSQVGINYSQESTYSMPSDIDYVSSGLDFDVNMAQQEAINNALLKEAELELRAEREDESILAAFGESQTNIKYEEIVPEQVPFFPGSIPNEIPINNLNFSVEEKKKKMERQSIEKNVVTSIENSKIEELSMKIDFLLNEINEVKTKQEEILLSLKKTQNFTGTKPTLLNDQKKNVMNLGELIKSKRNF